MRQVETSTLHRGVAGARHAFVPLPPSANKLDLLLQVRAAGAPAMAAQPGACMGGGLQSEGGCTLPQRCCACLIPRAMLLHPDAGGRRGAPARQAAHDLLQHAGQLPGRCDALRVWLRRDARCFPPAPPGVPVAQRCCCPAQPYALPETITQTPAWPPERSRPLSAGARPADRLLPRRRAGEGCLDAGRLLTSQSARVRSLPPSPEGRPLLPRLPQPQVDERKAAIQSFAHADLSRPPLLVCTDLAARWAGRGGGAGEGRVCRPV